MQEKKLYNVLWFDDKHLELPGFKMQARQNDIMLSGFRSLKAGIDELERKYRFYDAILLDAKFFETEEDVEGDESVSALNKAKDQLLQFPKKFQYFVLTGQAQLFEDQTFNSFFPQYFRKGIAEDIQRLFSEIKKAGDQQADTQVRHEYRRIFEVCTDKYIGEESAQTLLEALKNAKDLQDFQSTENLFISLRRNVIEKLFAACNRIGILPDSIKNEKGWLNNSCRFLTGKHPLYKLKKELLHPTIASIFDNLFLVLQDSAHAEGKLKLEVDSYIKSIQSPYLYKSVVFQTLDILLWFKQFSDQHPDKNENCCFWERVVMEGVDENWIEGEVVRIADNGYGTFMPRNGGKTISIPPNLVVERRLKETQVIEVTTKLDSTGNKTFIKEIRTV